MSAARAARARPGGTGRGFASTDRFMLRYVEPVTRMPSSSGPAGRPLLFGGNAIVAVCARVKRLINSARYRRGCTALYAYILRAGAPSLPGIAAGKPGSSSPLATQSIVIGTV